jgi:Mn-dependent DtxR family transcriptional regulator
MTHDRVGSPEFALTQQFLAMMLGVRRATVTVAAGMLQEAGLLTYSRGHVTVLDRSRLEEASCDCYRIVEDSCSRAMTPGGPSDEEKAANRVAFVYASVRSNVISEM